MGREVAVLRAGRLVQTATPTVLYRTPVDLDVARFVGEAVVLPGQARAGAVECALGTLAPFDGATAEGPVDVMIRPEQIQARSRRGRDASRRRGRTRAQTSSVPTRCCSWSWPTARGHARRRGPRRRGTGAGARGRAPRRRPGRRSTRARAPRAEPTRARSGAGDVDGPAVARGCAASPLLARRDAAGGCRGGGGDKSIVLYNGQHLQLTRAIIAAFEKETGVSVRTRSNSGVVLADLILQEGDSSPADVYLTENSPELMNLEEHGLLAKLDPSVLEQVPARYSSPQGKWVGVAQRVSSLVCNPSLAAPPKLPRSILDLAQPQWKGKLGIAPTRCGLPAGRRRRHRRARRGSRGGLARRPQAEREHLPGRRGGGRGRQSRRRGLRDRQLLLLVPPAARAGSRPDAQQAPLLPELGRRVGGQRRRSGRARLVETTRRTPSGSSSSWSAAKGRSSLAKGDDYEYPVRPGVRANSVLPPLAQHPARQPQRGRTGRQQGGGQAHREHRLRHVDATFRPDGARRARCRSSRRRRRAGRAGRRSSRRRSG